MNILTVNCGSSSLKMRLCAVAESGVTAVFNGAVEAIGPAAVVHIYPAGATPSGMSRAVADHAAALHTLLDLLGDDGRRSIEAVGHRVVQGGAFTQPHLIDDEVLQDLSNQGLIAPDDWSLFESEFATDFINVVAEGRLDSGQDAVQVDVAQRRRFVEQGILRHHVDQGVQTPGRTGQKPHVSVEL